MSPDEQSSATYRLTVFFIIEIPGLVIDRSNFAGRAELRSLRSLRYRSVDGIFHNRDTFPTYYFSSFAGRAELRLLRPLRYLSVDGIFHDRDTFPTYYVFDFRRTSRAPLASLAPLPIG